MTLQRKQRFRGGDLDQLLLGTKIDDWNEADDVVVGVLIAMALGAFEFMFLMSLLGIGIAIGLVK